MRLHGPQKDLKYIHSAGQLEALYGDCIRQRVHASSDNLAQWLCSNVSVSAPVRICQKWMTSEWSSSGKLLSPVAVEESIGQCGVQVLYR